MDTASFIGIVRGLIDNMTPICQITDAFMVSGKAADLCQMHDLFPGNPEWAFKFIMTPQIQECKVNTDMPDGKLLILPNGDQAQRKLVICFHPYRFYFFPTRIQSHGKDNKNCPRFWKDGAVH